MASSREDLTCGRAPRPLRAPARARVVVAPDKFKGSATARHVAAAVAEGMRRAAPAWDVLEVPVADGGEGTVDAALAAGFAPLATTVAGPVGEPRQATIAVRGDVAIVELAQASGIELLPGDGLAPLRATSRGTGDLVRYALDRGCRTIVLGVGGSACSDGGAGMLAALGATPRDAHGEPVPDGGGALRDVASVDLDGLDPRVAGCRVILASDVDSPLLGPDGAVAVYGPQKGADAAQRSVLEEGMANWARLVGLPWADAPGAGAAGGVGFAALAALHAHRRPGVDVVLELVDFEAAITGATLVVTGEGRLDEQSLRGKAPMGVIAAARAHGLTVVAVSGQCALAPSVLRDAGVARSYALADLEPDVERSMRRVRELLVTVGATIAADVGRQVE
ncbi:MAG TPA: glycerate kinase [Cellulomonas sp.]